MVDTLCDSIENRKEGLESQMLGHKTELTGTSVNAGVSEYSNAPQGLLGEIAIEQAEVLCEDDEDHGDDHTGDGKPNCKASCNG